MEKRKYQIPFWEAVGLIISIVAFSFVLIPNYQSSKKESNRIYLTKVINSIRDIVNSEYIGNFDDPNILVSASARVNPGKNVKITKKLSASNGIIVESNGMFGCIKLTSTGAISFLVNYKSEC